MSLRVSAIATFVAVVTAVSADDGSARPGPGSSAAASTYEVRLPPGIQRVTGVVPLGNGDVILAGVATAGEFAVSRDAIASTCNRTASGGCGDGFLLTLDRDGAVKHATLLGGSGPVSLVSIAPADAGQVWALVSTTSTAFGTRPATVCNGTQPVLLLVNAHLTEVEETICVGGPTASLAAHTLAAGPDGAAWVAGTECRGAAEVIDAWQPRRAGACDVFVAKYRPRAQRPVFATYLGGSQLDYPTAVAVAPDGDLLVTGVTTSRDFPTVRAAQPQHGGTSGRDPFDHDAFLARVDVSGRWLEYATYLGGASQDEALDVSVNARGEAIVVGSTSSADFWTGAAESTRWGTALGENGFVAALDPTGDVTFARVIGGSAADRARASAVLSDGQVLVVGQTSSPDFPGVAPPALRDAVAAFWSAPFALRIDVGDASLADGVFLMQETPAGDPDTATSWQLESVASDGSFAYAACGTRRWSRVENEWSPTETGRLLVKWRAGP